MDDTVLFLRSTSDIVTAFVTRNSLPPSELPQLIQQVHAALARLGDIRVEMPTPAKPTPAVGVKKSVGADYLICLEDGRKFKSLKRHLLSKYGMTPDDYRVKWSLPKDYPMVAPAYSAARSALAKQSGLGIGGRQRQAGRPDRKATAKKSKDAGVDGGEA